MHSVEPVWHLCTASVLLHPPLGSQVQERHGPVGADPEEGYKVVTELGQLSCEDTERASSAWRRLQSDIRSLPVPKGAVRKQERGCLQGPGNDRGE